MLLSRYNEITVCVSEEFEALETVCKFPKIGMSGDALEPEVESELDECKKVMRNCLHYGNNIFGKTLYLSFT